MVAMAMGFGVASRDIEEGIDSFLLAPLSV